MPAIFRAFPPIDLITQILEAFGLKGLDDAGWFTKEHVRLDILDTVLPELDPYYIPCKSFYLRDLTSLRAITILRQVLKTQGVTLKTSERARAMWYHIEAPKTVSNGDIVFS